MPPDVDALFSRALARTATDMLRDLDADQLAAGSTISHYRIIERIGEGGMGVVYKAEDTQLGRPVAIKMLAPAFQSDKRLREGFEREAKAASALNHPTICTVYDFGEHDGNSFIVMEYLDGETLKDRITRGPMPEADAIDIALQVCAALEAAHRARIVHCDIKPANIFIGRDARVKVLDFGTARLRADSSSAYDLAAATKAPGLWAGTRAYMSPEQERGDDLDRKTDIYSLGLVLRDLTGGGSGPWKRLIREMTEPERRNRIGSIDKVAAALKGIRRNRALFAVWGKVGIVAAIAAAAVALIWLLR